MPKTFFVIPLVMLLASCAHDHAAGKSSKRCKPQLLTTIADAREHPARPVDTGKPGDSAGDILTFDQPLLDEHGINIGTNSGLCVRTRPGYSFQCQWTLSLQDGTIQVAGQEFDAGRSAISIVGGTGAYTGIHGQMISTNNGDGTFTQTLRYRLAECGR